eukprot:1150190-Pelagomonas_calceolata.AAC.10
MSHTLCVTTLRRPAHSEEEPFYRHREISQRFKWVLIQAPSKWISEEVSKVMLRVEPRMQVEAVSASCLLVCRTTPFLLLHSIYAALAPRAPPYFTLDIMPWYLKLDAQRCHQAIIIYGGQMVVTKPLGEVWGDAMPCVHSDAAAERERSGRV